MDGIQYYNIMTVELNGRYCNVIVRHKAKKNVNWNWIRYSQATELKCIIRGVLLRERMDKRFVNGMASICQIIVCPIKHFSRRLQCHFSAHWIKHLLLTLLDLADGFTVLSDSDKRERLCSPSKKNSCCACGIFNITYYVRIEGNIKLRIYL